MACGPGRRIWRRGPSRRAGEFRRVRPADPAPAAHAEIPRHRPPSPYRESAATIGHALTFPHFVQPPNPERRAGSHGPDPARRSGFGGWTKWRRSWCIERWFQSRDHGREPPVGELRRVWPAQAGAATPDAIPPPAGGSPGSESVGPPGHGSPTADFVQTRVRMTGSQATRSQPS